MARKGVLVAAVLLVGALGAMTAYGATLVSVSEEDINRETSGPRYMVKPAIKLQLDLEAPPPDFVRPITRVFGSSSVTAAKSGPVSAAAHVSASAPLTPSTGVRASRPAPNEIRARVTQVMDALAP